MTEGTTQLQESEMAIKKARRRVVVKRSALKAKRGRPLGIKPPERIRDSAASVFASMVKTRTKAEREMLRKQADEAASA